MKAAETSKYCPNCNASIRENALFCHKCGFSFDIIKETSQGRKILSENDAKEELASDWFAPSIETGKLTEADAPRIENNDAENISIFSKTSVKNEDEISTPADYDSPTEEIRIGAITDEIKTEVSVNKDETSQLDIEEADIKERVNALKNSFESNRNDISAPETNSAENADATNLKQPENEETDEETDLSTIGESSKTSSKQSRKAPPRRQISKTREYVWEEPQRDVTPLFFITALIFLASVLAVFWLSGFLKI